MLSKAVLCLTTIHLYSVAAQGECTDLHGRTVTNGLHYIPGPDTCTLCICDNGFPRVCKAVLCSPPQDCRSFRVGTTCCEFICLDDVVKPTEGVEANLRVAAGGAAAIVLLTIALVVYRVRKQKRRRPTHADDQRSLTSIGYISGSMGYMGSGCETASGAWKPSAQYLPRGEAPPPYDEAIAQCRPDTLRLTNETAFHRSYPATVEALPRPEDAMQCVGHGYVNLPRPVAQIANTQNCFNAPLLQPVHVPESRESNIIPHHPLAPSAMGFPHTIRLTGSLGAISGRALSVARDDRERERPHNVPGFYTTHTSLHRTIPRISAATEASAVDAFSRAERAGGDVRRSFHRPEPARDRLDRLDRAERPLALHALHAHPRSVPRNLNIASAQDADRLDGTLKSSGSRSRAHSEEQVVCDKPKSGKAPAPAPPHTPHPPPHTPHLPPHTPHPPPHAPHPPSHTPHHPPHTPHPPPHTPHPPPHAPHPPPHNAQLPPRTPPHAPLHPPHTPHTPLSLPSDNVPPQSTLPLTVDKPSCGCSYAAAAADGADGAGAARPDDEPDDYRAECENCKATADEGWEEGEGSWSCGTQTLQRRAPPPAPPPPHTATLPQPVTRHERNAMGQPSNWENWFNSIPDSDSESEEE